MKNLAILTAFLAGYFVNDIAGDFATAAQAEVGGMDYYELKSDYDFKKAVRKVVDRYCEVDGSEISC